jgi:hypothetical protein
MRALQFSQRDFKGRTYEGASLIHVRKATLTVPTNTRPACHLFHRQRSGTVNETTGPHRATRVSSGVSARQRFQKCQEVGELLMGELFVEALGHERNGAGL